MAKPPRLRAVTENVRSGRSLGTASSSSVRSAGLPVPRAEVEARTVPWMAFNATRLPSPVADSAPSFGPTRFLLGSNLPWVRYGFDIGASAATPSGGLHAQPEVARELDEALARLRRDGVEHARVFLFCDGRAGIHFGTDGTPEGLDDSVFEDVDVLLATAERHRIGLMLVLFDAGLVAPPSEVDGVRAGGHADVLDQTAKREALLEHVVEPLLRRYGSHPAIDAWDIFDEPECATHAMHCPHPALSRRARRWSWLTAGLAAALRAVGLRPRSSLTPTLVPSSAMRSFLGAAVQAVHAHTRALATVGLASTANLGLVEGLGLDFYQAHWWAAYGDAPLRRAAADFRLDRPLVLGAFPASAPSKSVKTVLDTARCAGYGGAFLWSLRAVDNRGALDGQLAQWARNHSLHLYRRPPRVEAAAEPAPELAVEPVPEAVPVERSPAVCDAPDVPPSTQVEPDASGPVLAAAPA
jgi:hypothetical protein